MRSLFCIALLLFPTLGTAADKPTRLKWDQDEKTQRWSLSREDGKLPLLVLNLPKDGRPYFHPILAPDGNGILTEYAPAHHKHQTGLFLGLLKVDDRDYFHNRGADHFRREDAPAFITEDDRPQATGLFKYALLDRDGKDLLVESQDWTIEDRKDRYVLDLVWSLEAKKDVTFAKHDYGGLFLRMPWRAKTGGKAVNSEGQENNDAEGKKARWLDLGMSVVGRKDRAHVAILDHKDNQNHPTLWRVDGQLGVGPAPSRGGEWKLEKGKRVSFKYRLVIYTGELKKDQLEASWKDYVGDKK